MDARNGTGGNLGELPKGWGWTTFGEVAHYINGRAFKPSEWELEGRPIIRIQNLTGSTEKANRYSKSIEEKFLVRDGELLISWSATLDAFIYRGEEAVLNQHIFKVEPLIYKRFLYFLTKAYIRSLRQQVHGSGMQHITKNKFEESPIPLAPLSEQHRIVDKIEELFSDLDAGVAALQKAKAELKRYRQAALTAAVEGKLTAEWRAANAVKIEPASALLERIRAEREKKAKGKTKPLPPVNASELPKLPEGWCWAKLGECFDVERGRFSHRPRNEPRFYNGTYPFVQIGDLPREGGRITAYSQTLNDEGLRISKAFPKGTVLIAIVGATIANTGILTFDSCCPDSLVAIQSNDEIRSRFVEMFLRSRKLEIRRSSYASGGQPNINLGMLVPYCIPVAPLAEQQQIVAEAERRLSVADEIEKTVEASLKQAERLRQSILKRAFAGKLVPQDSNDEPAERLLERIRAATEKRHTQEEKKQKPVRVRHRRT